MSKVHIGEDPWIGSQDKNVLHQPLIHHIDLQAIYRLDHIIDNSGNTLWNQGWKELHMLGLVGGHIEAWNTYLRTMCTYHMQITNCRNSKSLMA